MKLRLSLFAAIIALGFVLGVRAADEPETELGKKMEKVGGAFRGVRRQASDASKNADSLAKVAIMKENLQAAMKLEPAKTADLPAGERKKFVADYQADMKKMLALVDKLEAAFKANNNEEANKLCSQIGDDQKKDHKMYKKADKK